MLANARRMLWVVSAVAARIGYAVAQSAVCLSHMLSLLYVSSVATARAGARSYVAPLCLATAVCCILPHSLCALRWARLPPAMRSAMCEFQVQGVQYGAQSIAVLPDTVRCRRDHLPHCIVVGLQCTALRRLVACGRESSSDRCRLRGGHCGEIGLTAHSLD